jgi:hypothetical protein
MRDKNIKNDLKETGCEIVNSIRLKKTRALTEFCEYGRERSGPIHRGKRE